MELTNRLLLPQELLQKKGLLSNLDAMTLAAFNALPYEQQLASVFAEGQFLATRWQAEQEAVNLYQLPDQFFVGLTYDGVYNEIIDLLSFDLLSFNRHDHDQLEDYAVSVRLPSWVPKSG